MGKQKHDQGWKKSQPQNQPAPIPNSESLAQRLVKRGLANPAILDHRIYSPRSN